MPLNVIFKIFIVLILKIMNESMRSHQLISIVPKDIFLKKIFVCGLGIFYSHIFFLLITKLWNIISPCKTSYLFNTSHN